MLGGLEIAPSKMVARGCCTDKSEYQDILVFTLRGEATAIPIITNHNMQQTTYDTLLRYLGIHVELDHSWQGQYSLYVWPSMDTPGLLYWKHVLAHYPRVDTGTPNTDSRQTKHLGDWASFWEWVHSYTMDWQRSGHMEQQKYTRNSRHLTG